MERLSVDVVRALSVSPEIRASEATDGGLGLLSGHFSKFNNWYQVNSVFEGNFLERTAPGFVSQTIAENRAGMRVLFNHGFDPQIGDKVLGSIQDLREDDEGAFYNVSLFDTSYNRDLLPGLKAGAYGASFRMQVLDDSWDNKPKRSAHNPDGLPERTITRAKVMEFGPVTFPANPEATAGVRSATDEFYEQLRQRDRGAFEAAVRASGRMPVLRATDSTIEELVAAADALLDSVEEALAAGDLAQTAALLTALDETIDSQMSLLNIPDSDEGDMGARALSKISTGRLDTRRVGGSGSKDERPGNGTTSTRTEADALRHHKALGLDVLSLVLERSKKNG